jgi:hypothetical protein
MSSIPFDQVAFLFLCIQHSGGKIDFNAVSREYEMTHGQKLTATAAYKRYYRLKEKIEEIATGQSKPKPAGTPKKRKKTTQEEMDVKKVKKEVKQEERFS